MAEDSPNHQANANYVYEQGDKEQDRLLEIKPNIGTVKFMSNSFDVSCRLPWKAEKPPEISSQPSKDSPNREANTNHEQGYDQQDGPEINSNEGTTNCMLRLFDAVCRCWKPPEILEDSPTTKFQDKIECPFTDNAVHVSEAYGEEVHLFLHVHLRGYDREGKGKQMDSTYYDKYGAPVASKNSWMEGYHTVEKVLAEHITHCSREGTQFPYVAGMAGGVHLYKHYHENQPWNWTGWIPLQAKWLYDNRFFHNRYFLALRGNEIQNNLWDYHPHENMNGEESVEDDVHEEIQPVDEYQGGYFFHKHPFGRYLHIISLKSHENTKQCKRYNYIVHPLAYRKSLNTLPDNSVDAMQWSIINIATEEHFDDDDTWGDRVHALEIFNDFTYFNSYQPDDVRGIMYHNGEPHQGDMVEGKTKYIYWFNSYPLEFGEFLLDSALARGVHLQTLTSNDAFYQRSVLLLNNEEDDTENKRHAETLRSDPKAPLIARKRKVTEKIAYQTKFEKQIREQAGVEVKPEVQTSLGFLNTRPYRCDTAFGYTTLIDTRQELKRTVFFTDGCDDPTKMKMRDGGLDKVEQKVMDYLIDGRFYSHTGVYDLFQYDDVATQEIPYKIQNQPDIQKLCYEMTDEMDLVFTFAKCKSTCQTADLIWRYSIMTLTESNTIETTHGYFKLDKEKMTKLDLRKAYEKRQVKWMYFTAFHQLNPQRRAWFSAIKGLAFNKGEEKEKKVWKNKKVKDEVSKLPELHHKVVSTKEEDGNIIEQSPSIEPVECESGDLDFTFATCPSNEVASTYVYFMQVCPLQQDLNLTDTSKSSKHIPPRIVQSVHGYFVLHDEHPTRLNLSFSWDKKKVKDNKVYFYCIHAENGHPIPVNTKPKPYVKVSTPEVVQESLNLE